MIELVSANWLLIVIALVIGIAVAWWIFVANRKTRVITTKRDVLDEGAAPAKRNQALIDAPSAAEKPGSVLGATPQPKAEPVPAPTPAPAPVAKATPKAAPKPKAPPASKAEPKPKAKAAPKLTAKAAAPSKVTAKPKAEVASKPAAAPKAKAAPAAPKAKEAPKPAAAPKAAPKPKAEAKPRPAAKLSAGPDELIKIKGIGPKLDKQFKELGITSFAQIAAWTDADIDRIDPQLGTFTGRIRRDAFVEQAKLLARGDIAGFEAKFGAL